MNSASPTFRFAVVLLAALAFLVSVLVAAQFLAQNATICSPAGLGDGSVPQPSGAGPRLDVRVATWNVYYWNSTGRVRAGLRAIASTADVIGLQEFGPSRKQSAIDRTLPEGFTSYTTPNNMTGVVWRASRFDVVDRGVERSFGVVRVENGGSGTTLGPRSALWVQLRQKSTGAMFTLINTHIVPTIDHAGHPDRSRPDRLQLYQTQIDQVGRLTARFRANGPVFVTGDFNVDAVADAKVKDPKWPYVAMQRFGLYSNWRAVGYPRLDRRIIDYVWETATTVAMTGHQVLPAYGSDHRPVVVNATNQPARRALGAAAAVGAGAPTVTPTSPPEAEASVPDRLVVPGPDGKPLTLTGEQVHNAAIIIGEGKAHSVPAYGWLIALAAALQESGIKMLDHGDRDSVNMFQQRPSEGWGTPAQLKDPHLAAQAFFGVASHTNNPGLTDIKGWRDMTVTEAAQAVQRSAFPGAYAKWQPAAGAIVKALTGDASVSIAAEAGCGGDRPSVACPATESPAEKGLTPDAMLVLRCGKAQFPLLKTFYGVGQRPANTDDDHQTGRAVDLMLSDVFADYKGAEGSAYGWKVANWMRDNHAALGVHYVIFAAKIWNIDRDREGWRSYGGITGSSDDTSLHYDHIHVSVFGTRGSGFQPASDAGVTVAAGKWVMPLAEGSYRVGCGFGCYPGHGGQDFPAHSGTPVYATNDGTVVRSVALKDRSGRYRSYGNLIVIQAKSDPKVQVFYAHLQRRQVATGATVRAGQLIGLSGYTGHVIPQGEGGAHLHYEIRVDGNPVNPLPILTKHGVKP